MSAGTSLDGATSLKDKVLFITGGSRGIGLAIAERAARDGARIVLAAKTLDPNPRLPGTLRTAVAAVQAAGGEAFAVQTDIRDELAVAEAVRKAVDHFGGIDILVNNASAISLTDTAHTQMKRFDLMHGVNARGTFACTQACIPALTESAKAGRRPKVLTLSPPLNLKPHWFAPHLAYTMAKYGMSLCTLGHAAELRPLGIAVNSLWPRTVIATAALQMIPGVDAQGARQPAIMADAAWHVLTSSDPALTGRFLIDDEVLVAAGERDFAKYSVQPGRRDLLPDLFLD
jgi:citronellol/citronellal dehydrogenase